MTSTTNAPTSSIPSRGEPPAAGKPVMSRAVLLGIVLVAGMSTMATEMTAFRLLAPFFGSSTMVWANIIGLILIYLSVGYWYGGRIADRHPHPRGLSTVILLAAITVAIVPFVAHPVLSIATGGIESLAVSSMLGSFFGSLILFAVPITLLGMVPPYAVRLALSDVGSSGQVAGSLYAVSTIGSIMGTFLSVLVVTPMIGTRRTFLVFALALAVLALAGLGRRRMFGVVAAVVIGVLLALPPGQVKASTIGDVIFEEDSRYQFVQVVEQEDGRRLLQLNEGWAVHSVYQPGRLLTGGIWDHFLVLPSLRTADAPDVADSQQRLDMLLVGNAAGTAPRIYRHLRPNVHIDGVEIDPLVTRVGYEYFDMGGDNLTVHSADGRPFLERSHERWDVIHIDAYRQPYIPFYLTTREFFELVRDRLEPGGVLAINVGSVPDDKRVQEAISATMRDVFPSVHRYQAEEFNEVIVANVDEVSTEELSRRILASDLARSGDTRPLFRDFAGGMTEFGPQPDKVLTDDHAPVELMTDSMILDFARQVS